MGVCTLSIVHRHGIMPKSINILGRGQICVLPCVFN